MLNRRQLIKAAGAALAATTAGSAGRLLAQTSASAPATISPRGGRPNILVHIADDLSWAHVGCAGEKAVKTPNIDRIAAEGVMFTQAFCSAPSCTPSRAALLTGRNFWELEGASDLWGSLPEKFAVYTSILQAAGYVIGKTRKGYAPGTAAGWKDWKGDPAGPEVELGKLVEQSKSEGKPFCYWFGSKEPHRPYTKGAGVKAGIKLDDITVPAFLPDNEEVRGDLADYLEEVQQFDGQLGGLIKTLQAAGEIDNTIVVVLGDNGLPFPRCKTQLYDYGARCPMIIRWPKTIKAGRKVDDPVIYPDLAPTLLEAVGLKPHPGMTGLSLMSLLASEKSGTLDPSRRPAYFGRETHGRELGPYPTRAVRTGTHLYIRNFDTKASPELIKATDPGPTKKYMDEHKDDPKVNPLWELAYGQRPGEELYEIKSDPYQMKNLAADEEQAKLKSKLADMLVARLRETKDPRLDGKRPSVVSA